MATIAEYREELIRRGPDRPIYVQGADVAKAKRLVKAEPELFTWTPGYTERPCGWVEYVAPQNCDHTYPHGGSAVHPEPAPRAPWCGMCGADVQED